ncbi:hypothetical protein MACA111363_02615 [Macrococcoides canis]|uniref:Uncharacterized protein n=1 Tax=Macrococcoides canis TaxID=1855823 RepID=A0A1W7ABP5_9STAP|nr:hypothetical protein [Macrococcus canis]ARQ07032.1 hypothetical protein MCCS_13910 [Macrococcus canis]
MDNSVMMPGYCESCGKIYQHKGMILGEFLEDATFGNIILGTCPNDGGIIRGIPGEYAMIDGFLEIKAYSNKKELEAMIKVLKNVKAYEDIKDVEQHLSAISEDYYPFIELLKKIMSQPHNNNMQAAINILLGLITIAGFGLQVKNEFTASTTEKNSTELVRIEKEKLKEEKKQTKILKNIHSNSEEKRMPHLERKSKIKEKKKSRYKKRRK